MKTIPKPRKPRTPKLRIDQEAQEWKIRVNTQYILQVGQEMGLGPGTREFMFAKIIKRKFAADVAWPDHKLLVEIEGGVFSRGRHTRGEGYENDCEKYSIASILGFMLVRVSYGMIADGRAYTLLEMAANKIFKEQKNVRKPDPKLFAG